MNILQFVLSSLYFVFPILCNTAPILFKFVPFLNYPVDFNKKFNSKPIFGKNKTFRGLFSGILTAIILVAVQAYLYRFNFFKSISIIQYDQINILLLGFLFGFGALFGDLVKSFFKRRLDIKPGANFFPWDQLDFIIGALIFVSFIYIPQVSTIIFLVIIIPFLHIFFNYLGFWMGLKKNKM